MIMTKKFGLAAVLCCMVATLCGCASHSPRAPRPPHLVGSVNDSIYTSARGGFSVPYPVRADRDGGIVADGPQSVTFHDNWGSRITFFSRGITDNSPMMSMLEKQGREKALSEFARREYGNDITIHYHPEDCEGLVSFIYLRMASPPQTAAAIFLHGDRVFLVEDDMVPGWQVIVPRSQQDSTLENQVVALALSIQPR
jgi:hypothetical protein